MMRLKLFPFLIFTIFPVGGSARSAEANEGNSNLVIPYGHQS
jgi:hypothetical protein